MEKVPTGEGIFMGLSTSREERETRLRDAEDILTQLRVDITGLVSSAGAGVFLGLLNLKSGESWSDSKNQESSAMKVHEVSCLYGISSVAEWVYAVADALDDLVQGGVAECLESRHDKIHNFYRVRESALEVIRKYGTADWAQAVRVFLARKPRLADKVDLVLLHNHNGFAIDGISRGLRNRGFSMVRFQGDMVYRDVAHEPEMARFHNAGAILALLGNDGWRANHEETISKARHLGKKVIPVLIGDASEEEMRKANGLFSDFWYVDLRNITEQNLDELARVIRDGGPPWSVRMPGPEASLDLGSAFPPAMAANEIAVAPEADAKRSERAGEGVPFIADQETAETARPVPLERVERLIGEICEGRGEGKEDRGEVVDEIRELEPAEKLVLAARLREEIVGPYSPKEDSDLPRASRSPQDISTIRSWMLNALTGVDAESVESRECLQAHLSEEIEPYRCARYWILAGLAQVGASYLKEALAISKRDSAPEVALLARAIDSPSDRELIKDCRGRLASPESDIRWEVLRVLRVVAIPDLAEMVCDLLEELELGTPQAYDALIALTLPTMRQKAAVILGDRRGRIASLVEHVRAQAFKADGSPRKALAKLLAHCDPVRVDRALSDAFGNPEKSSSARRVQELLRMYREQVRQGSEEPPPENPDAYRHRVATGFADRASHGRAVGEKLEDSLQSRRYATHIAQLIAAKESGMPISIGLFGAWGSGKSHFIDLVDEQIREVTKNPGEVFHRDIVQIRFNAWHYLDTNLWANLVCEIFDQLFKTASGEEGDPEVQKMKALKKELAENSALAAEANVALKLAEAERKKAEADLQTAMMARAAKENDVRSMLDELGKLVNDDALKKELENVGAQLGLPQLALSYAELEAQAREVGSLSGRVKAMALAIFSGQGWWVRGLLLVVALAVPAAVWWLSVNGGPWIVAMLSGVGGTIAEVAAAVAAFSTWLGLQIKAGSGAVSKLEETYAKVKAVRNAKEATGDASKARAELEAKRTQEDEARKALNETEQKVRELKADLADLAPGRQLMKFLKTRASAEDYKRHLGLVSLVRKDFEQLSDLLMRASEERQAAQAEGRTASSGLPQVDRIVLYIDDLDRCRAERVIEVLEAVHLLLAFRLFAVVVAVDPRWLRQSLLERYPSLLEGPGGEARLGTELRGGTGASGGRLATPQDYLEKIFQVPFHLRAMDDEGYRALVKSLFPARPVTRQTGLAANGGGSGKTVGGRRPDLGSGTSPEETGVAPSADGGRPGEPIAPTAGDQGVPHVGSPGAGGSEAKPKLASRPEPTPPPTPTSETKPPDPERIWLSEAERADLEKFQPLFDTPRAVKRFANTYFLIRVSVEEGEWGTFMGSNEEPGTYRVPMLLLAGASAFPSLAQDWLRQFRDGAESWDHIADSPGMPDVERWGQLKERIQRLGLDGWIKEPVQSKDLVSLWAARVARYSF
jgi:hypothetical protein